MNVNSGYTYTVTLQAVEMKRIHDTTQTTILFDWGSVLN